MNEIQLIRNQLAAERQRASAVVSACASALDRAEDNTVPSGSPLEQFRRACVEYLVCVLTWFEERDQRLADLAHTRLPPNDGASRALGEVLAQRGRSRETLEKLAAAFAATRATDGDGGPQQSWRAFAEYFNSVWDARRAALEALLAPNRRVSDWRSVGGIDADSILEERRRYARVGSLLPAGVTLTAEPRARAD